MLLLLSVWFCLLCFFNFNNVFNFLFVCLFFCWYSTIQLGRMSQVGSTKFYYRIQLSPLGTLHSSSVGKAILFSPLISRVFISFFFSLILAVHIVFYLTTKQTIHLVSISLTASDVRHILCADHPLSRECLFLDEAGYRNRTIIRDICRSVSTARGDICRSVRVLHVVNVWGIQRSTLNFLLVLCGMIE